MHGVIFGRLKEYVDNKLGPGAWTELLRESGIGERIYLAASAYPDEELVRLVTTASSTKNIPIADLLEDFGRELVPTYLGMYGHLIKPEWRTLDVVEHTEETIHKVVRIRNPGASPPVLRTTRSSKTEIVLEYTSARRLCAVARGIVRGVAAHYEENVSIDESACMLKGARACVMSIRVA
jgi:predicted hydrocarbon binding protein